MIAVAGITLVKSYTIEIGIDRMTHHLYFIKCHFDIACRLENSTQIREILLFVLLVIHYLL